MVAAMMAASAMACNRVSPVPADVIEVRLPEAKRIRVSKSQARTLSLQPCSLSFQTLQNAGAFMLDAITRGLAGAPGVDIDQLAGRRQRSVSDRQCRGDH
jgi:hypothetical protein